MGHLDAALDQVPGTARAELDCHRILRCWALQVSYGSSRKRAASAVLHCNPKTTYAERNYSVVGQRLSLDGVCCVAMCVS